jgi:2,4-dienoyl-CoA reductase-like NADH-dependent reductase (Old Yellow Enzyme family)
MLEGEDHGEMYQRLKGIATTFRNHGALHIDDNWIKMKYVSSLMPVEPISLKSPQGSHNYHAMTSNKIMQEIQAFKVAIKNAEDAHAAIGMQKRWKPSFEGQGCGT